MLLNMQQDIWPKKKRYFGIKNWPKYGLDILFQVKDEFEND